MTPSFCRCVPMRLEVILPLLGRALPGHHASAAYSRIGRTQARTACRKRLGLAPRMVLLRDLMCVVIECALAAMALAWARKVSFLSRYTPSHLSEPLRLIGVNV